MALYGEYSLCNAEIYKNMLTFIVNPNSGGESGFKIWKVAERRLEKLKIPYKVFITDGPGDATRIAREVFSEDSNVQIVAVGGDGTLNEIINGLDFDKCRPIGYIPTGTGNDMARNLNLGSNVITNLKRVLEQKDVVTLDYGVLSFGDDVRTNRRFSVSCGIGYDAAVVDAMASLNAKTVMSKVKLHKAMYTGIGAIEMFKIKPCRGYIILNDERKVEFNDIIFISVQNLVTEGGGKKFAPTADPKDGELTLCIMHTKSFFHFVKLLASGLGGNHLKYQGARTYNCKNVKIHTERPLCVHADGELMGNQTDLEVRCVHKKLRIIV